MVTKDDLVLTKHAQDEMMDDGISRAEIVEAIVRGPKVPENGHFVTVYRYFTVAYARLPNGRVKIITVHIGRPTNWKGK